MGSSRIPVYHDILVKDMSTDQVRRYKQIPDSRHGQTRWSITEIPRVPSGRGAISTCITLVNSYDCQRRIKTLRRNIRESSTNVMRYKSSFLVDNVQNE
jgi:hypothetical protein